MPHRLFLVHGMGVHDEAWAEEVVDLLRSLYGEYPRLNSLDFDVRIDPVPIRYDDIFVETLEQFQGGATSIEDLLGDVNADEVGDLVNWFEDAADSDNFLWTHAADVILYRLFSLIRQRVKTRVALRLAEGIHSLPPGETRWSVLAHSLGTAVVHDSLDMLMTGQLPGDDLPGGFAPDQAQANLVMMVSNVSRVLQTNPPAYESVVMPGAAGQAKRGCIFYFNVRHSLDPFSIPKKFDPQDWPDPDTAAAGLYRSFEVNHIQEGNIHGLKHFLRNPEVHVPLFRTLTFKTAITKEEEANAIASFPVFDGLTHDQWTALKERLEETNVASISDTWRAFRRIWDSYQLVKAWADQNGVAF